MKRIPKVRAFNRVQPKMTEEDQRKQQFISPSKHKLNPYLVIHFNRTENFGTGGGGGSSGTSTLSCIANLNEGEVTLNYLSSRFWGIGEMKISGDQQYLFVGTRDNSTWPASGGLVVLRNQSASWSIITKLIRTAVPLRGYGGDNFAYNAVSSSYDGLHIVVGDSGTSSTMSNTPSGLISPSWWTYDCLSGNWNSSILTQNVPYPYIPDANYVVGNSFSEVMATSDFYFGPVMSHDGKAFTVFTIKDGNKFGGVAGRLLRYERSSYSSSWSFVSTTLVDIDDLLSSTIAFGSQPFPAVRAYLADSFYKSDSIIWVLATWAQGVLNPPSEYFYFQKSALIPYRLENSVWVRSATIPPFISEFSYSETFALNGVGNDRQITRVTNRLTGYIHNIENNWYVTRVAGAYNSTYDDASLSQGAIVHYKLEGGSWNKLQTIKPDFDTTVEYSYINNDITYSAVPACQFGLSVGMTHDMKYMVVMQKEFSGQRDASYSYFNTSARLIYLYERENGTWKKIARRATPQATVSIERYEVGVTNSSFVQGAANHGNINGAVIYTGYRTVCN